MKLPRQKLFFWGTAISSGLMALGLKQGADQSKESEEQNQQQIKAMNKIAKAAEKNPQVAQQFLAIKQGQTPPAEQKEFALVNPKTVGNATGFAKDIGKFLWKRKKDVAGGLMMGAGISGITYGVDKMIQHDMKKNGIPLESPQQKQYAATGSVMSGIKKYGGKALKFGKDVAKDHWKSTAIFGTVMATPLAANYIADKQQYKDQVAATKKSPYPNQQQREFGWIGSGIKYMKELPGTMKKGWNVFKSHPGRSTLDGISKVTGGGGKSGRAKMVNDLSELGKESGNQWTQKTAEFLGKHQKTAAGVGIGVGYATTFAPWGWGEKGSEKVLKKVDKNAMAYRDSKEQAPQ